MKQILQFFSVVSLLLTASISDISFASNEHANNNNGIGIAVGDPGGITIFHKLDSNNALQAFISRNLLFGGDYLLLFPKEIHSIPELTPYVGGGFFLFTHHDWYYDHERHGHNHHDSLGIAGRMPLGLLLQLSGAPLQFHFEIAPSVTITPFMYTFVDAMVGVRFTF